MSVVPTHTSVYSFGVYESCGELSAAAELVAATLGSARDDVSGRARAKMRKVAWPQYWGRECKRPSDAAQLSLL